MQESGLYSSFKKVEKKEKEDNIVNQEKNTLATIDISTVICGYFIFLF